MTQLLFPYESPPERDDEPRHAELRRDDPVPLVRLASGGEAYLVSRYSDVRRVFVDRVFSRAAATRPGAATLRPARMSPHVLVSMDPPDHTRLRGLVNRAFTPRTVERMRPAIQQMTDRLIDGIVAAGPPADFVELFALPLPAMALAAMLGVPDEDHLQLRSWMDVMMSITAYTPGQMRSASRQMLVYLAHLAAAKRAEPGEDLLSGLIAARDGDNRLSESELLHTALIILTGGYETTAMLLANSVLTLSRNVSQWELMQRDPGIIPAAVEELLRYTRISRASLERVATEDVELSGVQIPAGSTVIGLKYSAHRDEELISDPDRFDITRNHIPHLAFGLGVHHCIGASLARLELTIAYETLARRLPGLRPAVPDQDLNWKHGLITRGPEKLPVTW